MSSQMSIEKSSRLALLLSIFRSAVIISYTNFDFLTKTTKKTFTNGSIIKIYD